MKRIFACLLALVMVLTAGAGLAEATDASDASYAELEERIYLWAPDYVDYDANGVWVHDSMELEHPRFVVFPNITDASQLQLTGTSEEEILAYLQETGVIDLATEIIAEVVVVLPEGETWSDADVETGVYAEYRTEQTSQQHMYDWAYMTNVRLLGFGDGATFVGDKMTGYEEIRRVAGVFLYGGDMTSVPEDGLVVTAYLSGNLNNAETYFKNVVDADSVLEKDGVTVSYNSTYYEDILRVGVGPEGESMDDALRNAWYTVFQYQYRYYLNSEPYGPRDETNTRTFNYEDRERYNQPAYFQPAFVPGEDIIETSVKTHQIGAYASTSAKPYEYFLYAPAGREDTEGMPLVVSFAGSTNDPRYVAMINGWIDQVGKGEYILLVPNHSGNANIESMNGPVLEALIQQVCEEYKLDTLRVYATSYGNSQIVDENGFAYNGVISAQLAYMYPDLITACASSISCAGVVYPEGRPEELNAAGAKVNFLVWYGNNDMYANFPLMPEKMWNDIAPLFSTSMRVINGMPEVLNDDADWENAPYYGIPNYNRRGTAENPEGYTTLWGTQADSEGVDRLMFCVPDGMSHQGCASFATFTWDYWFSQFAE